jgi:hypothetical protein
MLVAPGPPKNDVDQFPRPGFHATTDGRNNSRNAAALEFLHFSGIQTGTT